MFFIFHEKVSIQDAPACFGPGQISMRLYPDCFPPKVRFGLEAQAQGPLQRLGIADDEFLIREISRI
jgi:hypothetical protein